MQIYVRKTKKFLTLWYFTYLYEDDLYANKDWPPCETHFVGTIEDFEEMRAFEQTNYGSHHWNIRKRHATEEEYKDYLEGWVIC